MSMLDMRIPQKGLVTYGRIRRRQPTSPLVSIDNDVRPSKRLRLNENEPLCSSNPKVVKQVGNDAPQFDVFPDAASLEELKPVKHDQLSKPTIAKPKSFSLITRTKFTLSKTSRTSGETKTAGAKASSTSETNSGASKKKKPLTQMLIDFEGTGAPQITCKTCGMSYTPSLPEDANIHKKFHANCVGGVDFALDLKAEAKLWHSRGNKGATYVVAIDQRSSANEKRKAMEVLEVASSELGSVKISESVLWSQLSSKRKHGQDDTPSNQKGRYKVFLYVVGRKCVGMCLAEKIDKALPMDLETMSLGKLSEDEYSDSVLGISRLWTCSSHRRLGIASRLLDCASKHFYYGLEIDKEKVAFSMPTESGAKFASVWSSGGNGCSKIPVYME